MITCICDNVGLQFRSDTRPVKDIYVKKEVKLWNLMILPCSGAWLALYIATSARVYDAVISRRNFVCF